MSAEAQPGVRPEAAGGRAVRFRGGGFQPQRVPSAGWLGFAALLALWQGALGSGLLDPVFLPSPAAVVLALRDLILSGELFRHLAASLGRIAGGWMLGTLAGLAIGGAMGLSSLARSLGVPLISAFFPIPKIALLPLMILWFGIGEPSKIATIGLGVFFPTAIATYSSMDGVPRNLIRMAQSFDVPPVAIVFKVVLPGALPGILAGMRISASIALLLLVAAEMIGAQTGIGVLVLTAGNLMQTDRLIAGVAVLSVLGLAIGTCISACERRLLRWR
ncbi:MAG: ABC transporter permease [Alphaproteobacteria bacterium]|nr:ABC transporter permease [Alphaproteobacteria bacterium]